MTGKELIKLLKQHGWTVSRVREIHHGMKKDGKTEIIPVHKTDLSPGLLNSILKRAGLKERLGV